MAETVRVGIVALQIPHPSSAAAGFVTMSLGVATREPDENLTPAELILRADAALYVAKRDGRNRWAVSAASAVGAADGPPAP